MTGQFRRLVDVDIKSAGLGVDCIGFSGGWVLGIKERCQGK